jgi:carboxypeptidase C (cathepsin A)
VFRDDLDGTPAAQTSPAATSCEAYSGERPATTTHSARVDGREIKYTATAGTLPLKDASGKVTATHTDLVFVDAISTGSAAPRRLRKHVASTAFAPTSGRAASSCGTT